MLLTHIHFYFVSGNNVPTKDKNDNKWTFLPKGNPADLCTLNTEKHIEQHVFGVFHAKYETV